MFVSQSNIFHQPKNPDFLKTLEKDYNFVSSRLLDSFFPVTSGFISSVKITIDSFHLDENHSAETFSDAAPDMKDLANQTIQKKWLNSL